MPLALALFAVLAIQAAGAPPDPRTCSPGASCPGGQAGGVPSKTQAIEKSRFELTDALLGALVSACPKGVPVLVVAAGSDRAVPMRDRLVEALRAAGYQVTEDTVMTPLPTPDSPLTVQRNPGQTVVTIDPNI